MSHEKWEPMRPSTYRSPEEYCQFQDPMTFPWKFWRILQFAIGKIKFDPAGTFLSQGTCSLGPVTSRWRATKSGQGQEAEEETWCGRSSLSRGAKLAKNLIPDDDEDIFIFEDLRI